MRECYVSFASAKEVHEFVSIATRQFFPIHVEQEDLRLNAKSIMSLFCMGLNRPFRVVMADADADPEHEHDPESTESATAQAAPFHPQQPHEEDSALAEEGDSDRSKQ